MDQGLTVDPEGSQLQLEGGIIMGLGYTLSEEIHFNGSEILARDFGSYQIPRFSWAPKSEPKSGSWPGRSAVERQDLARPF